MSVDNRTFHRVKGEGLVTEVFNEDNLRTLTGNMAIGHVRYSTTGGGGIDNVQPSCSCTVRATSRWLITAISSTPSN